MKDIKSHIAIFASGNGSNAENIVSYFSKKKTATVDLIVSNNNNAFVLERAVKLKIDSHIISRNDFKQPKSLLKKLKDKNIDFIILAGFLWLIPSELILAFPKKIINIHPALLPKYGGKGMYGDYVHQAVSAAGETESGISIHYVNQSYDEGDIIFQKTVNIKAGENPEKIAEKVHALEYEYFPKVIEQVIL
ncbi:MAG: phosphoribosylglycinamide formyltransferase [Bacteroidetes bacterium]|nr:MAG: phosphoribosylglycinamide formyltransferase [Bacteroidota bacterium]